MLRREVYLFHNVSSTFGAVGRSSRFLSPVHRSPMLSLYRIQIDVLRTKFADDVWTWDRKTLRFVEFRHVDVLAVICFQQPLLVLGAYLSAFPASLHP